MPTAIAQHLLLHDNDKPNMAIEIYMNDKEEIYVAPADPDMAMQFWFTISREDWPDIKNFIDSQFEKSI